jgi:hypothetical protein
VRGLVCRLGLCEGAQLEQLRGYLGEQTLAVIVEATDATQAALALTPDALAILQPQIDAFLAVHRRSIRPEQTKLTDGVQALLEDEDAEAPAEEEEALSVPFRASLADAPAAPAPAEAAPPPAKAT